MKLRLLDLLTCPKDKSWPLLEHIFEERRIDSPKIAQKDETTDVVCTFYCAKKKLKLVEGKTTSIKEGEANVKAKISQKIDYNTDCKDCLSIEIISGMIECPTCGTFYPIIEEIPVMLQEGERNEEIERAFIEKWAEKIKELTS